jgi:crotonobetainyl-CoA:carnitine CoA-transferase CaiB-like acyl-CoA transferase
LYVSWLKHELEAQPSDVEVDHPTAGRLKLPGPPYKLSETPATVRMPPPLLGQHTDEILGEIGFSPAEIQNFRVTGAV